MDNIELNQEPKQKVPFFKSKVFIIILVVLVIGVGVGSYIVRELNMEQKAREAEEEYIKLLSETANTINEMNEPLQKISAIYAEVWNVSIKEDLYLSGIAKYLGVEESVVSENALLDKIKSGRRGKYIERGDFNTALITVRNVLLREGIYNQVETTQSTIAENVKSLNNPPEKYKDIYDGVVEYYTTYAMYLDLATSPTGSYITYTRDINELSTKLESQYSTLQVSMP
jgi:hypothetical protein